ncbi:MAG TPA: LPS export ABC transporter periplasmic protein LptC [Hyphomicrobiaceae bacterium]|nr:LPS export ABC transporter periplasmic protein LptC [Hyphomicrobiaceae bacterium]
MAATIHAGNFDGSHGDRSAASVASAQERLMAFRKARRHTWIVRTLKLVLPGAAVLSVVVYGALVLLVVGLRPKNFDPGTMRISSENLVMENPKYDGYGKDGTRYQVRARNAVTDLKMSGPVRLNDIDGDLVQQTGTLTKVTANWGLLDQKKNELELYEKINIDSSNGMTARLTRATIYTKENRVISNEPVVVEMPTGTVRGKTMSMNTKSRQVTFDGDVSVRLKPPPGREQPAQGARPAAASPLPGLALSSNAPIDVWSDILEVDDNAKTALFRRNVRARQGDAILTAPELDAIYEGRASNAIASAPATPNTPEQATRLKFLKARGGVVMVLKEDRAEGETLDYDAISEHAVLRGNVVLTSANDRRATSAVAEFDRLADTALLTGDVVVTQGKNVMKGQRLFVEHKLGKTRLESPAQAGQPSGRIAATFYRNEAKSAEAAAGKNAKSEAADAGAGALPLGAAFKTDPKAPIDVEADTLDVLDQDKVAVFKGSVRAKQADFVIRCAEMTAHYTGQTGLSSAPAAGKGETREPSQLTKINARQKVVITSGDGRTATGDWADFDVKTNMAVVGGKVVVSQGKSVIEGTKLFIDMNTGQSRIEVANAQQGVSAINGAPAGAAAACPEGQVCKGRIRAVFYPKEIEAAKKKAEERAPGAETKSDSASKPSTGTSSWSSTTRRSGAE